LARRLKHRTPRPAHGPILRPARRLGKPVFDLHGQSELLALTYSLGGLGVIIAWIVDPLNIGNRAGMAILLGFVFAAAIVLYAIRNHPPQYTGDLAIIGSLVLIDLALFFTKLHSHPGLLSPFFVWVGFASPLWFPRRRATLYVLLAMAASGLVIVVAGSAEAVAGWVITTVTLIVAFCITSFLSDALVKRERLAVVGEMASVVGHDLRNPLGAASNALFLLHHSLRADATEDQNRLFHMAEREIAKASDIISDLSSYVRPGPPVIASVDLDTLIDEVLEVVPAPTNVDVRVEICPITLLADKGQLAQVLTNLVTNAYDAMGDQGSLHLTASVESRTAVIRIEDDGPGIEPSLGERIFEPFYTTKHQGTGLGLANVRRLVEAHGGSVHLDSSVARGTRFIVRLPCHPRPKKGDRANELEGRPDSFPDRTRRTSRSGPRSKPHPTDSAETGAPSPPIILTGAGHETGVTSSTDIPEATT
jgi:signal transduction histidine kinase